MDVRGVGWEMKSVEKGPPVCSSLLTCDVWNMSLATCHVNTPREQSACHICNDRNKSNQSRQRWSVHGEINFPLSYLSFENSGSCCRPAARRLTCYWFESCIKFGRSIRSGVHSKLTTGVNTSVNSCLFIWPTGVPEPLSIRKHDPGPWPQCPQIPSSRGLQPMDRC